MKKILFLTLSLLYSINAQADIFKKREDALGFFANGATPPIVSVEDQKRRVSCKILEQVDGQTFVVSIQDKKVELVLSEIRMAKTNDDAQCEREKKVGRYGMQVVSDILAQAASDELKIECELGGEADIYLGGYPLTGILTRKGGSFVE